MDERPLGRTGLSIGPLVFGGNALRYTARIHDHRPMLVACSLALALAHGAGAHAQSSTGESSDARATSSQADAESNEQARSSEATVTPLLTKALSGIDGKEVATVVVEYGPGGASPPHRHNADVFVYVLEGSVVMQVAGGEEMTLTAGQTFYESPADVHAVSRNASDTEPAKILAFIVKDRGAPTTVPAD